MFSSVFIQFSIELYSILKFIHNLSKKENENLKTDQVQVINISFLYETEILKNPAKGLYLELRSLTFAQVSRSNKQSLQLLAEAKSWLNSGQLLGLQKSIYT